MYQIYHRGNTLGNTLGKAKKSYYMDMSDEIDRKGQAAADALSSEYENTNPVFDHLVAEKYATMWYSTDYLYGYIASTKEEFDKLFEVAVHSFFLNVPENRRKVIRNAREAFETRYNILADRYAKMYLNEEYYLQGINEMSYDDTLDYLLKKKQIRYFQAC